MIGTVVEGLFQRENAVVAAALILLTLLAWLALLAGADTGMSVVAIEKLAPFGVVIAKGASFALIAAGAALILSAAP